MPSTPKPKYPVYEPGSLWQAIADPANGLTQVSREFSEWEDGGAAYIYVEKDGQLYRLVLLQDDGKLYLDGPLSPLA